MQFNVQDFVVCSCFCTLWFLGFGHTRHTTLKDLVLHSRACCYALGPSIAHALARTHTHKSCCDLGASTHAEKEQRELIQVQRLCVARLLKRWLRKQVWSQVTGPLFGGSRPLTAQKGVQQQEKVEVWGQVAGDPFLKDPGRWRHKKGSSSRELEGMCGCCWAPQITTTGSQFLFVP